MIYTYTLAFNLFSETQNAVHRLFEQNDRREFKHYICDLGFPLLSGDVIPPDIEDAKRINTECLKQLAEETGSTYIKLENRGVSQNTGQLFRHIQPKDGDVLVSCEPDEIQNEAGWVHALASVLEADKNMGYCAPMLVEHDKILANTPHAKLETIGGQEIYVMSGNINFGQVGFSASFLNKIGGVPYLPNMPIYGGLEAAIKYHLDQLGMKWGLLKNYTTTHTNVPPLYRAWKDAIIYNPQDFGGQISFEDWLNRKRDWAL